MKKYILFLFVMATITNNLKAQYGIVRNKIVLPELIPTNNLFSYQLDSVLFIKDIVFFPSDESKERGYVFYIRIKEPTSGHYLISITYGKPTWVEDSLNIGIYTMKDYYFIIREDSNQTPLFRATGKNITFRYEKEILRRDEDSHYFDEFIHAEEFHTWFLSYLNNQLKQISRDEYYEN